MEKASYPTGGFATIRLHMLLTVARGARTAFSLLGLGCISGAVTKHFLMGVMAKREGRQSGD